MKQDEVLRYKILTIFLVIMLSIILLVFNIVALNNHRLETSPTTTTRTPLTTTTTKRVTNDYTFDEREKTLSLNGQEEVVVLRTYVSTNNYRIDYDVENFNPVKMGNNSLVLLNNSDNSITIEIENLSAEDYFAEYEKYTNSVDYNAANELDGYTYTYTFLRGNNVYLRVTKCITEDTASLGTLSYRMDYMINSIYIP